MNTESFNIIPSSDISPFRLITLSVTATSIVCSLTYVLKWLYGHDQAIHGLPYPTRMPIIGNLWCLGSKTHESFTKLAEQLGGRFKVSSTMLIRIENGSYNYTMDAEVPNCLG